jgi:type IV pilus assembly protein PilB
MYLEHRDVEQFLKTNGQFHKGILDDVYMDAAENDKKIEEILYERKLATPESLAMFYGELIHIPYVELQKIDIPQAVLDLIPEPLARRRRVVAFAQDAKTISIAMEDPEDLQTRDFLKKKFSSHQLKIFLATSDGLSLVLEQFHGRAKEKLEEIIAKQQEGTALANKDLSKVVEEIPIVKIVDSIFEYAIHERASDVHIEPLEKAVIIRNRIDGILRDVVELPRDAYSGVVARIKILANLKIDEFRLPQDGRFKINQNDVRLSIRVSVLPVSHGEKVVMRLLPENDRILTLEELGILGHSHEIVVRNIKRPFGMILATGPTGSGKTTTLYSILHMLNQRAVNITTIEDPIEYQLPRVNQSQVRPNLGYTFANGLRSILRQDPDIIMVGEIRDEETADISVRSAMTGHLVLSTLHTNTAAGTIPRLIDMQVKPFLIASTLNVVIAQRLVRRICRDCITRDMMDLELFWSLVESYPEQLVRKLLPFEELAHRKGEIAFYKGKGCNSCGGTGYKGRSGIYEVLEVSKTLEDFIIQKPTAEQIHEKAIAEGMVPMYFDGIRRAKEGQTTISEILRVTED